MGVPGGWELALVLLAKLALILLVVGGAVTAIVLIARSRKHSQPSHPDQDTAPPGQHG